MQFGGTDTLLVRAARRGREQSLRLLLELRADVNQLNGYGESPLFAACLESQIGAVQILHEAGASLSIVHDMTDLSLLDAAVRDFDAPLRASLSLRHTMKWQTAAAKYTAQLSVVRYLLDVCQIAPIVMELCQTCPSQHPLQAILADNCMGMMHSARRDLVRMLVAHGFTPNFQMECPASFCPWAKHPPTCTLLHMACYAARHCMSQCDSHYAFIYLLVEGKGDPTILNSHGETCFTFAERKNLKWMTKLLLQKAGAGIPSRFGGSAKKRKLEVLWRQFWNPPGNWDSRLMDSRDDAGCSDDSSSDDEDHSVNPGWGLPIWHMLGIRDEVECNIGPSATLVSGSTASPVASDTAVSFADFPHADSMDHAVRVRRDTPMLTRARSAGVEHRLKPLPESPTRGSNLETYERYKQSRQAVQIHNQQIVARAEAKLRKPLRI